MAETADKEVPGIPVWLPNAITLFRILLVPLVLLFIWLGNDGHHGPNTYRLLALIVFVVAGATDFLDGYLARRHHLVSNLGKLLDPLADKILVITVLVQLSAQGQIWTWITILFIFREFAVTGLRGLAADAGIILAAQTVGKWKLSFQIIALGFLILAPMDLPLGFMDLDIGKAGLTLLLVALGLAFWSGADYVHQLADLLRGREEE